jgi:UDP-2,3-diacylglucosamine pyrophosphatase LpxH
MVVAAAARQEVRVTSASDDEAQVAALAAAVPDVVVVLSDLHLAEGVRGETGRYARIENFFADQEFRNLLEHERTRTQQSSLLVLNGDIFDFPRVPACPRTETDFAEWSHWLLALGVDRSPDELRRRVTASERKYGLGTEDYKAIWKLYRIAAGHPAFFGALGAWVGSGRRLLFVKGNHDLELHWPLVRLGLRRLVAAQPGVGPRAAEERVAFLEDAAWIGNLYLEHGHRYEQHTWSDLVTLPKKPEELALPIGTLANRYLINPIEEMTPFLDNIKPVQGVLWALVKRHPIKALGTAWRSLGLFRHALLGGGVRGASGILIYLAVIVGQALALAAAPMLLLLLLLRPDAFKSSYAYATLALGVLPYLAAVARDLVPTRRPRGAEDEFGVRIREAMRRSPPAGKYQRLYGTMGHTHGEDVQGCDSFDGRRVLYLNSGTWIPLWSEDRVDLLGRSLRPFLRFQWNGSEYEHEHLQWNDDRMEPRPSVILERAAPAGVTKEMTR